VRQVIIALPSAAHGVRRRVAEICADAGIEVLTVPSYEDLISGRSTLTTIRTIELDDLLGRDPVVLDNAGLGEWLGNRVVMVTGAGGSIGAELCRHIARYRPAKVVLFDISEAAVYSIQTALADAFPQLPLATVVGDVKHAALVEEVLARERPGVIFHAGAYKHVPLMEETNAWQAVRNNAYGTWVLAMASIAAKVEKFVLVSSDKAVNPTNVMGATKRLAEIVCRSLSGRGTQFVLVRFGNVFGSAGSVIPRFREQIARGGPVTVTHPDITRYFMSLSEATQLLLQAALQGKGGEILVLDMGEPVRIVDLAHDMIRLSGADPDRIAIVFTGLRPGEKLFEELLTSEEATLPTPHPKLRIALARAANVDAVGQMVAWCERDRAADDAEVRARLKAWIPEYMPPAGAPCSRSRSSLPAPSRRRCRCARPAAARRRSSWRAVRPMRGDRGTAARATASSRPADNGRTARRAFSPRRARIAASCSERMCATSASTSHVGQTTPHSCSASNSATPDFVLPMTGSAHAIASSGASGTGRRATAPRRRPRRRNAAARRRANRPS
jgi:FlaA1/EpsC-like NDP-sugar epimerase